MDATPPHLPIGQNNTSGLCVKLTKLAAAMLRHSDSILCGTLLVRLAQMKSPFKAASICWNKMAERHKRVPPLTQGPMKLSQWWIL